MGAIPFLIGLAYVVAFCAWMLYQEGKPRW